MVSLESFRPKLRELLASTDNVELVSNAMWLMASTSASRCQHLKSADILMPCLDVLARSTNTVCPWPCKAQGIRHT